MHASCLHFRVSQRLRGGVSPESLAGGMTGLSRIARLARGNDLRTQRRRCSGSGLAYCPTTTPRAEAETIATVSARHAHPRALSSRDGPPSGNVATRVNAQRKSAKPSIRLALRHIATACMGRWWAGVTRVRLWE